MAMAASLSSSSLPLFKNVKMGSSSLNTRLPCLRISASSYSSTSSDGSVLLQAAKHTVDTYIRNGMIIGLGYGQALDMAIQYLGRQLRSGALKDIVGIPMSVASASEAAKAGIPLDFYQDHSQIDFAFDDADVMEEGTLVAVIGRRKLQDDDSIRKEKSILKSSKKLVFMVKESHYKNGLEGSIPVLVQSLNWMETAEEIDDLFLGDAEGLGKVLDSRCETIVGSTFYSWYGEGQALVRQVQRGVTSHLLQEKAIISLILYSLPQYKALVAAEVAENLDKIDGVVDHGVISKLPCTAVIASENGLRVINNLQSAVEGVQS